MGAAEHGTIAPMPTRKAATPALLDNQLLRAIANRGGIRNYAANAVLVTEDDRSDALFIILAGRVKAYGSADLLLFRHRRWCVAGNCGH